ncbi:MAG TPA: hypothetical protein VFY84_06440 [Jiangellales bacterium]|nr:hypothetical protein [Jiangellales bacterium]
MSRDTSRDDENLDLVDSTPDESSSPVRVLPRLDLGEITSDEPPTGTAPRRPSWQLWLVAILAFCLGAAGGGYAWNMRTQTAEEAEQAAAANIIIGNVIGRVDPASQIHHFGILMLNNGPRAIEVLDAHPPGWASHNSRPTTIPSSEWAAVRTSVQPLCEVPAPTQLTVQVRTDAGDKTVSVALPPGGSLLSEAYDQACGPNQGLRYTIFAGRVGVLDSTEPDTLLMRIELRPSVPATDLTITAVDASASGLLATATNLPVTFRSDRRSPSVLELSWRVTSCEATAMLSDIAPQVTVTLPDESTYRTHVILPGQAVAILARFAVAQCAA